MRTIRIYHTLPLTRKLVVLNVAVHAVHYFYGILHHIPCHLVAAHYLIEACYEFRGTDYFGEYIGYVFFCRYFVHLN